MATSKDIPGDAVASAAAHARYLMKFGTALLELDRHIERLSEDDIWISSISIRVPHHTGGEALVVCRAEVGGAKQVCFHASDCVAEALRGFVARMSNESLVWKDDQYGQ